MGGKPKPRRKPQRLHTPVFFIEYYDEKYRTSVDHFTEVDYQEALALLEASEHFAITDHGEFEIPTPIDFDFWKESCGFDEEED
jgi:hypothetical protein